MLWTVGLGASPHGGPPELEFLQPVPVVDLALHERSAAVVVLFRNCGGQMLHVRSVRSECWCATATVLRGSIPPDSLGALYVMVSRAGIGDSLTWIQFLVESNACNSPTLLRLAVRRRE